MSKRVFRPTVLLLAGVLVQSCGSAPTAAPKGAALPGPETQALATALERVSWVSDPHFYRSGRVVALYVGRQASMLSLLQKVLGQQIAGK